VPRIFDNIELSLLPALRELAKSLKDQHPRMFKLARQLALADQAIINTMVAQKEGRLPNDDETIDPYFDAQSEVMHAILCEPARNLAGVLLKAWQAMRIGYHESKVRTPEEAYAAVAEYLDLGNEKHIASIWADLERLAARA
jgi:hypothetical protein